METRNLTNDLLASYVYTLNSTGQRTRIEEGAGGPTVRVIEYDDADRLIAERITDPLLGSRTITYAYDPMGNRLTKTDNGVTTSYTYDDNDRLLSETPLPEGAGGGFTYTYDNNGNMLTKTGNGETWQLAYDALNQLTGADITTSSGATNVTYAYDHDGIRIGTTVNGTDVTRYLVDKNRPYAQVLEEQRRVGGLTTTTSYVYGDTLLSQSTSGISHYSLYDGLGSARGLTDSAGTLTDAYSYDAYGNWLDKSGSTRNVYGYRGEQYDEALEAYYLRARYYQPGSGRFVTTDPVEGMMGDTLSHHRYIYGYSNPVNNLDPSGAINLQDTVYAVGLLGNLAAGGVMVYSMANEDFGDMMATWLPDAGSIGISFSVAPGAMRTIGVLRTLFAGTPLTPPFMDIQGGGVFGLEILFSISSAQYGMYLFGGFHGGVNLTEGPQGFWNAGAALSHGWVWNLWNTHNYIGPFASFNMDFEPFFGLNFFKDAKNTFENGPFGMSSKVGQIPTANPNAFSFGGSYTWYPRYIPGTIIPLFVSFNATSGMFEVACALMSTELLMVGLSQTMSGNIFGAVTSLASVSWPMTILVSKNIWNTRRPQWNVEARQNRPDRPPLFSSGTKGWRMF